MKYFELKIMEMKEKEKVIENLDSYLKKIKKAAKRELKDAEIYLFGSILTKKFSPRSDIDVAIISDSFKNDLNSRAKILSKIKKEINFNPWFEIHLLTKKEFGFYRRFIKKLKKI